jgi:hypothetical protein
MSWLLSAVHLTPAYSNSNRVHYVHYANHRLGHVACLFDMPHFFSGVLAVLEAVLKINISGV